MFRTTVLLRRFGIGRGRLHTAALIFEFQLFRDLIQHLDAARLEHLPEIAQLIGVGFEIGERGEYFPGGDEATGLDFLEHFGDGGIRG